MSSVAAEGAQVGDDVGQPGGRDSGDDRPRFHRAHAIAGVVRSAASLIARRQKVASSSMDVSVLMRDLTFDRRATTVSSIGEPSGMG